IMTRCCRWSRRLACVVFLIVATPSLGLAGAHLGVEGGLNLSSLRYDRPDPFWTKTEWRTSVTGGASLEIPLRPRLALASGLRFVRQGNRVKIDTGPAVGEFRLTQDY